MIYRAITFIIACCFLVGQAHAQDDIITLEKIFSTAEFRSDYSGQKRWIDEGNGYTMLQKNEPGTGLDIVKYNTTSGEKSVLISASSLVPSGASEPLRIENYEWSHDKSKLLIYTNSKRVWRQNTKGDYWVKDLETGALNQLGKDLPASSLMFAKFSPDDSQVAYVSKHNIYRETVADNEVTQLTFDGTEKIINGTFDWAYEEEFGCRDGFRWSPDSKKIAYWQLDASPIKDFLMINNTDSLYSYTIPIQYPKVGTDNSTCKVGVLSMDSKNTTWLKVGEDESNHYIPRMYWADNSEEILLQRLNRKQNVNTVIICDAASGTSKIIYTDKDNTWLNVVDDLLFFNKGKDFTWVSEKNGWNNVYKISRDGKNEALLTPGNFDVINIELIDTKNGWIYYRASPNNATQKYLYRNKISSNKKLERLTPENQPGTHSYDISPNGKWAFHTYSKAGIPPITELVSLPEHKQVRVIVENKELKDKLAKLKISKQQFFTIEKEGISFDYYMITPPNFDKSKKYPVLFNVYGEPAGQTVLDTWGGRNYLYHQMLAQQGYIIMSIDNRGTPAPKGREWRKSIYAKLGVISSQDQADVTKLLIDKYAFIDKDRIGIWGWSGGGSMTLNALFRYPKIYTTGISVAPVADIHLYDNIYQERYCGLLTEKAEEYIQSSPVNFAKNLEGKLLLVHGTGDDNVHYQNSEVLINELIKQNKVFSFMSYPNRSHGIYEGYNTSRHLYETMFSFIKNNL
ncbi:S9 family peptidase [Fulvivirga sediminis]|uniref:S9 family peptidase n=1 Tax=Fulvivirga sediminis TaxID=2803949 RepID=A0A937K0S4_9BACT|nr:S9 family peptidase [Fulvivirga sediminis]MBL3655902.1 S9 family peptidase [Fulvivirga sediminis]